MNFRVVIYVLTWSVWLDPRCAKRLYSNHLPLNTRFNIGVLEHPESQMRKEHQSNNSQKENPIPPNHQTFIIMFSVLASAVIIGIALLCAINKDFRNYFFERSGVTDPFLEPAKDRSRESVPLHDLTPVPSSPSLWPASIHDRSNYSSSNKSFTQSRDEMKDSSTTSQGFKELEHSSLGASSELSRMHNSHESQSSVHSFSTVNQRPEIPSVSRATVQKYCSTPHVGEHQHSLPLFKNVQDGVRSRHLSMRLQEEHERETGLRALDKVDQLQPQYRHAHSTGSLERDGQSAQSIRKVFEWLEITRFANDQQDQQHPEHFSEQRPRSENLSKSREKVFQWLDITRSANDQQDQQHSERFEQRPRSENLSKSCEEDEKQPKSRPDSLDHSIIIEHNISRLTEWKKSQTLTSAQSDTRHQKSSRTSESPKKSSSLLSQISESLPCAQSSPKKKSRDKISLDDNSHKKATRSYESEPDLMIEANQQDEHPTPKDQASMFTTSVDSENISESFSPLHSSTLCDTEDKTLTPESAFFIESNTAQSDESSVCINVSGKNIRLIRPSTSMNMSASLPANIFSEVFSLEPHQLSSEDTEGHTSQGANVPTYSQTSGTQPRLDFSGMSSQHNKSSPAQSEESSTVAIPFSSFFQPQLSSKQQSPESVQTQALTNAAFPETMGPSKLSKQVHANVDRSRHQLLKVSLSRHSWPTRRHRPRRSYPISLRVSGNVTRRHLRFQPVAKSPALSPIDEGTDTSKSDPSSPTK